MRVTSKPQCRDRMGKYTRRRAGAEQARRLPRATERRPTAPVRYNRPVATARTMSMLEMTPTTFSSDTT